jgi:hypothetical protein
LAEFDAHSFSRREKILLNIKKLRQQIRIAENDEDGESFRRALKLEIAALGCINREVQDSQTSNECQLACVEEYCDTSECDEET